MENKNIPTPPPTATDGDGSKKVPSVSSSTAGEGVSIADTSSLTPPPITNQNNVDRQSSIPTPPKESTPANPSLASNQPHKKWLIWFLIGFIIIGLTGAVVIFVLNKNNKIPEGTKIEIKDNTKKSWFGKDQSIRSDENENIVGDGSVIADKCRADYDKLLEVNGFDFDKYCINKSVRTGDYDGNAVPQKKKNLVLIFDASGSMASQIGGKRKIDIAKEAAWKFIDQVAGEKDFALSIVVYGHKGGNAQSQKAMSCAGIEEVYYLGDVDAKVAKSKLNAFDATGWTPIAGSFQKAKEILLNKPNDENFILLVSDGKEMCNGDPVATIAAIKNEGLNVKADVIGFDVGGVDEAQLKAIAEAGDGDYFSVSNAVDLENAFAKHKEMLNEVDFKIGRTVEQLYDISFVINNYNQCRVMLKKEEVAMMLDIHANKLVGEKCENFADTEYKKRFNDVRSKIESIYKSDKAKFNALKQ